MARKKVEKAHWTPDEKLRPLTGYHSDDDKHLREETVVQQLTDAELRKAQHDIAAVRATLADTKAKIDALKNEMRPHQRDEADLLNALVTGTLETSRVVYEYADDEKGLVHQYDPETLTLLATRPLKAWERQHEIDFDEEAGEEASEDGDNE